MVTVCDVADGRLPSVTGCDRTQLLRAGTSGPVLNGVHVR